MADAAVRPWTREELARLPDDGNRYEVLDGALFVTPMPSWRHQRIAADLTTALNLYCRASRIGMVVAPGSIIWSGNELQPDVLVYLGSVAELEGRHWTELPTPAVVVEVESSSSRQRDRFTKRVAYVKQLGIAAYWLVDPLADTICVFTPSKEDVLLGIEHMLEWSPTSEVSPFRLPLSSLFHPDG